MNIKKDAYNVSVKLMPSVWDEERHIRDILSIGLKMHTLTDMIEVWSFRIFERNILCPLDL